MKWLPGSPVLRAIAGVIFIVFLGTTVLLLEGVGVIPIKWRSEDEGAFTARYRTYDAFGHRGTLVDIFLRRPLRDELIAKEVVSFWVSKAEPSLLFYETGYPCDTHYYDARSGRTSKIPGCPYDVSRPEAWSPDRRYVALGDVVSDRAYIVTLDSGKVLDVGKMVEAHLPRSFVTFGPWVPDGNRQMMGIVVLVVNDTKPAGSVRENEEDVYVVYPKTGRLRYIASTPGAFAESDYRWQLLAGAEWILPISLDSVLHARAGALRKPQSELPQAARW